MAKRWSSGSQITVTKINSNILLKISNNMYFKIIFYSIYGIINFRIEFHHLGQLTTKGKRGNERNNIYIYIYIYIYKERKRDRDREIETETETGRDRDRDRESP